MMCLSMNFDSKKIIHALAEVCVLESGTDYDHCFTIFFCVMRAQNQLLYQIALHCSLVCTGLQIVYPLQKLKVIPHTH